MYATVYFTYRDHNGEEQVYTRTFSSSNYESYALTMDAACDDRNKALVSRQTGDLLEKTITVTVNDLWSECSFYVFDIKKYSINRICFDISWLYLAFRYDSFTKK